MNPKPQTLIVRIWLEPTPHGPGLWRASVHDPSTKEQRFFNQPGELAKFWLEAHPLWPLPLKEER